MQIKEPPVQLCTSCHEHDKIKEAVMNSNVKHSVAITGNACLNCHTAHGGDLAKLMRAQQVNVCMKCHNEPIDPGSGRRKVAAVSEVLDPKLVKHGPAADGSCGGCHDVHGGNVTRLLKKDFPEVFYQGFELKKYDLCFSCHDKQLVLTQKTTGLTNFRNGEENLHFLHVNKADKGRSCRACHSVHASPNPLHIRDSVPFGSWNMPINYKRMTDGGSCSPGCHKPYSYDRKSPVIYDPAEKAPAPQPGNSPTSQPAVSIDPTGGK
jgi:predicted CXXCH cytochrome family protein